MDNNNKLKTITTPRTNKFKYKTMINDFKIGETLGKGFSAKVKSATRQGDQQ